MQENTIILYTTHCPACKALETMLKKKGIEYEEVTDIELMLSKGFTNVPKLQVGDQVMSVKEALAWVKSYGE